MKKLAAFNNDPALKAMMIEEAVKHRLADEFVQGDYGSEFPGGKFKGCDIGCTIRSLNLRLGKSFSYSSHGDVAAQLGFPVQLVYLFDRFFERLPEGLHLTWQERHWAAIPVGADVTRAVQKYFIWAISDPEQGLPSVFKEEGDKQLFMDLGGLLEKSICDVPVKDEEINNLAARFAALFAALFAARFDTRFAAEIKISAEKLLEFLGKAE